MDKFLIEAPSIKSLQGDEGAELPTDKLVELGYLLVDVEPTQAEFDNGSAKAIVIATPRRRAVAIASSFDSLVADDSHFDGDIGWYSYFDFLIAHKSYDECIKYIRFIRAVGEVLAAVPVGIPTANDTKTICYRIYFLSHCATCFLRLPFCPLRSSRDSNACEDGVHDLGELPEYVSASDRRQRIPL